MALANSEALRRAGVHEDFAAPAGGAVVRDASGRLTGLLKDAAMDVVNRARCRRFRPTASWSGHARPCGMPRSSA